MRTTTAPELAVLAAATRTVTQRVKVANGSGTLIDLTAWVEEVTRNEDIDRPVSALTIHFRRDSGTILSLSPLRTDSTLNRLDDGTTYSPQLQGGRVVTWEVATTPIGTAPVAGDYKLKFKGTIDDIDFDHSPVTVECRDQGGVIVDRKIEVEAAYGSTGGVALETVMQQNLDTIFGSGFIPLDVPVSPSFLVSPAYIQQRQSEMDAQQALAQLPGWDVRYWWDSASSSFKFRLQQPPRTKTIPDHTFGPSSYYAINRLSISRREVKNVIAISYFDIAANARLVVTVSDSASITKYGREYFFLQEPDGGPINSNAKATNMANAILLDTKEPKAEGEIEMPFFWPAELWDLDRFSANGVHINTDQDWAVVSITDKISRGRHRTFLTVRGAPAGGYLTWLDREGITEGEHRPGEVGPEPKIEVFGPMTATQAQVLYTATGGTAPLTYQRRIDVDDVSTGTYSAVAALGSGVTEWITLHVGDRATRIFLRVIDATGLQGNADPFFLPGQVPGTDKPTGLPYRAKSDFAVKNSGGTTAFGANRHNDEQIALNADAKTFGVVFDGIPQMRALPQSFLVPIETGVARTFEFKATGVSVAGYTARAVVTTGATSTARTNDFAATLNGTPVGAGVAIDDDGEAAYCNLANANTTLTTYTAYYDLFLDDMDPANTLYVDLYRNDGIASTSWTLVGSASYGAGGPDSGSINFNAALAVNWDTRIVISYQTTPLSGEKAIVTCDRMDYNEITAGTETAVTTAAGNGILFQAMEAP